MKYQPDPYLCRVIKRKDNFRPTVGYDTPLFDTWVEAHSCLVDLRTKAFYQAQSALRAAERALQRAQAMQPPQEEVKL